MKTDKMINLFKKALVEDKLEQFIIGSGEYFILDREYGDHWPWGAYSRYIDPFLKENGDELDANFWKKVGLIFQETNDLNIFLDFFVAFLKIYFRAETEIQEKRIKSLPDIFSKTFVEILLKNKQQLLIDKRGTGQDWSAKNGNGLWEGILKNLKILEDIGGPDFYSQIIKLEGV